MAAPNFNNQEPELVKLRSSNMMKNELHLRIPGVQDLNKNGPVVIYSPVTDLAMNLNELSTCR